MVPHQQVIVRIESTSLRLFRHHQFVVHPFHQPHAVSKLFAPSRASQHNHHYSSVKTSHERFPAFQTAASLAAKAPLAQQLVRVLQQAYALHHFSLLADFPRQDAVLPGRADLAEERDLEALRGQFCDVDGRAEITGEAVRVGEGAIGETHLLRVLPHEPQENRDVVLPVFTGEVEAAEVPTDLLLEHVAPQVVGYGERDVVGGLHEKSIKSVLERDEGFFLGIEEQFGASDPIVLAGDEEVEVADGDEIFLDDFVGGVEGEQLGNAGYLVGLAVLVPLDNGLLLHAVDDPLLGRDVVEGNVPQHPVPVGDVRLRQPHQDRMRQHCLGVHRPPFLQRTQLLGTDAPLPDEQLGVVLHRLKMKDSLMEESGVVAQVLFEQRQWLLGYRLQLFHRKVGEDGPLGLSRRCLCFERAIFIGRLG